MNYIGQLFEFLQKLVIWWITVMPWEEAVHVRMGKTVKVLKEGLHLRIPFIDRVYIQDIRVRIMQSPPQTVTTKDGKTITLIMSVGYSIVDIYKLYNSLYHVDQTLCTMMQGIIAEEVYSRDLINCFPVDLEYAVKSKMIGDVYGLRFDNIKIVGFAIVKTYRLIQDSHWLPDGLAIDKQKV